MVEPPTPEDAASADATDAEPEATDAEPEATLAPARAGIDLGKLAVFLLIFEALTGLGLMFHYRPTVEHATLDLLDLREVSRFGFVRELHHWGAQAALIVVWLHFLRTALRGAYAPPRHRNWAAGIVLMLLVMALAGTGYLLPWDQDAYWGLAALSPWGKPSIDGSTLLYAYVWHCAMLPLSVAGLTVYHLRQARRDAAAGEPGTD